MKIRFYIKTLNLIHINVNKNTKYYHFSCINYLPTYLNSIV